MQPPNPLQCKILQLQPWIQSRPQLPLCRGQSTSEPWPSSALAGMHPRKRALHTISGNKRRFSLHEKSHNFGTSGTTTKHKGNILAFEDAKRKALETRTTHHAHSHMWHWVVATYQALMLGGNLGSQSPPISMDGRNSPRPSA